MEYLKFAIIVKDVEIFLEKYQIQNDIKGRCVEHSLFFLSKVSDYKEILNLRTVCGVLVHGEKIPIFTAHVWLVFDEKNIFDCSYEFKNSKNKQYYLKVIHEGERIMEDKCDALNEKIEKFKSGNFSSLYYIELCKSWEVHYKKRLEMLNF